MNNDAANATSIVCVCLMQHKHDLRLTDKDAVVQDLTEQTFLYLIVDLIQINQNSNMKVLDVYLYVVRLTSKFYHLIYHDFFSA